MVQTASKVVMPEVSLDETSVTRPLAKALVTLATVARASGNWIRVFDIRYATAGIPCEITDEYVMFPQDSIEVLETGSLSGPAANYEMLKFPKLIALQAVIHAEICMPSKPK